MTRRTLVLGLLVALPLVGCGGDSNSDTARPTDGTEPTFVDDPARPTCTADDQAAILERVEGHVLVWIDEAVTPDLTCDRSGTWTWEVEGLADAAAPNDLRAEVGSSLDGVGMTGHNEADAPERGWRTIWRGACSPTVDCLIDVSVAPATTGSSVGVRLSAQHADHAQDRELAGDEFAEYGLTRITAAPVSDYCADAVAAIQGIGSYRAPTSTLTTETIGPERRCNTVPLAFELAQPQRFVTVEFWGADVPYLLQAFDAEGHVVAESTGNAVPYDYDRTFAVSIDAGAASAVRFTFGYETAGMHVIAVRFGELDPGEREVRFDGFRSKAEVSRG